MLCFEDRELQLIVECINITEENVFIHPEEMAIRTKIDDYFEKKVKLFG